MWALALGVVAGGFFTLLGVMVGAAIRERGNSDGRL